LIEQVLGFTALFLGIGLAGAMVWLQNRPKTEFKVSLIPHTPLMFVGALIAIIAGAYLLSVYGIDLPERGSRF